MKHKETMGDRVRLLRKHYGLSQHDFAGKIGMKGHVGLNKIENGATVKPQGDTINNMVSVFGTTRDWLLEGKGEMLPNGDADITVPLEAVTNPYRDFAIQRMQKENDGLWQLVDDFRKGRLTFLYLMDKTG